jgi:hypothetical protein
MMPDITILEIEKLSQTSFLEIPFCTNILNGSVKEQIPIINKNITLAKDIPPNMLYLLKKTMVKTEAIINNIITT